MSSSHAESARVDDTPAASEETTLADDARPDAKPSSSRLPKLIGGLVLLVVLVLVAREVGGYVPRFAEWVDGLGVWGPLVFIAGYAIATVGFVPGSLLTLAAGAIFGIAAGTVYAFTGASLGAIGAFLVGRYFARDAIESKVAENPRFAAIDRAVEKQGLRIVTLLRLSPAFPFILLNYALGLTRVRLRDYAIGCLGMIPGTLLYVYYGRVIGSVAALAAGRHTRGWYRSAGWCWASDWSRPWRLPWWSPAWRDVPCTKSKDWKMLETAPSDREPTSDETHSGHEAHSEPLMLPDDEHNRRLVDYVHPHDWQNPTPQERYHLVVIGAGTAGLVTAIVAAGLGAKVALVERHLMGGDCLNVGCVPSKGLISAARAWDPRRRTAFGAPETTGDGDFAAMMERMRRLRADISHIDGAQRFTDAGVDVFLGEGRFVGDDTVEVGDARLRFRKAVICTGARAAAPPIPGLDEVDYLTNETLFSLEELPKRFAVIGGGPIGCEMAQSFTRFGSEVTLLDMAPHVLPREDEEAAAVVQKALSDDGVKLELGVSIERVQQRTTERGSEKVVRFTRAQPNGADTLEEVACDALLVAVGRKPNVESLGLDTVGVEFDRSGVVTDERLRTTNKRIFAAGDVTQGFKFTHLADAHAGVVIQNALFFGRARQEKLVVPWCTYTSPEVAHVGLYQKDAEAQGKAIETLRVDLDDVDRALLDGEDEGFLKLVIEKGSDRIVGATLVADHAGDMLPALCLAVTHGIGLSKFAGTIFPYPTQGEVMKKAANAWRKKKLSPFVKRLFETWFRIFS